MIEHVDDEAGRNRPLQARHVDPRPSLARRQIAAGAMRFALNRQSCTTPRRRCLVDSAMSDDQSLAVPTSKPAQATTPAAK